MGNPSRACGTKKEDGCYGEGPEAMDGGVLRIWTWVLGDGINNVIPLNIPPLIMVVCNPAATLAARELVKTRTPVFVKIKAHGRLPFDPDVVYGKLLAKTKNMGVVDHVGKDNYSAYSFAKETIWHGPSRKIPPQLGRELADIIWRYGPIPMLFTHDRMPVFDSHDHLERCVDIVADCYENTSPIDPDNMAWIPTWEEDDWSQYVTTSNDGSTHILVPILAALHEIERNWPAHQEDEKYIVAREFFKTVRMMEQPFGLSWLAKVTYTADEEGQYNESARQQMDVYGDRVINFLDLADLKVKEDE